MLDAPTIAYLAAAHGHQILAEDDKARYDPSGKDFFHEVQAQLVTPGAKMRSCFARITGLCINFDDVEAVRKLCRAFNDAALTAWGEVSAWKGRAFLRLLSLF